MKLRNIDFKNGRLGSAVTIAFKSKSELIGWGKKLKSGAVEFYIPASADNKDKEKMLSRSFMELTNVSESQVEIVVSNSNTAIISVYDLSPEELDKCFDHLPG